jgi:hypothetical protein
MIPRHLPTLLTTLLLGLTLACTKSTPTTEDSQSEDSPTEDSTTDDSAADDSTTDDSTTDDSATDDSATDEPEVTLSFFTAVDLAGFAFRSPEHGGFGTYLPIEAQSRVSAKEVPGTWFPVIVSADRTACNQGEAVLLNDGESHEWTFADLPGVFVSDGFTCVMP